MGRKILAEMAHPPGRFAIPRDAAPDDFFRAFFHIVLQAASGRRAPNLCSMRRRGPAELVGDLASACSCNLRISGLQNRGSGSFGLLRRASRPSLRKAAQ